jgi:hypothetical protein
MDYTKDNEGRGIAGVVIIPEKSKYRILVAWDWTNQVKKNIVGFFESEKLFDKVSEPEITETCNYGHEIGRKKAIKYFSGIIKKEFIIGNTVDY